MECRAQRVKIPKWHAVQESHWMLGLDYLAIDDSGRFLLDPFNIEDHWQLLAFPSRLSFSRKTSNNFSYHLLASYSLYAKGKVVDGQLLNENRSYWSLDLHTNFHLRNTLGWGHFLDPFLGLGVGYNRANKYQQFTLNAWAGALFWVADRWAIQLSSMAKFSMSEEGSNHLVHSAGLVYRFSVE
jgi:hypothetical protein